MLLTILSSAKYTLPAKTNGNPVFGWPTSGPSIEAKILKFALRIVAQDQRVHRLQEKLLLRERDAKGCSRSPFSLGAERMICFADIGVGSCFRADVGKRVSSLLP